MIIEDLKIFIPEIFPLMMFLLIQDIFIYVIELPVTNSKSPESFLPAKFNVGCDLIINKHRRASFDITNKVGN